MVKNILSNTVVFSPSIPRRELAIYMTAAEQAVQLRWIVKPTLSELLTYGMTYRMPKQEIIPTENNLPRDFLRPPLATQDISGDSVASLHLTLERSHVGRIRACQILAGVAAETICLSILAVLALDTAEALGLSAPQFPFEAYSFRKTMHAAVQHGKQFRSRSWKIAVTTIHPDRGADPLPAGDQGRAGDHSSSLSSRYNQFQFPAPIGVIPAASHERALYFLDQILPSSNAAQLGPRDFLKCARILARGTRGEPVVKTERKRFNSVPDDFETRVQVAVLFFNLPRPDFLCGLFSAKCVKDFLEDKSITMDDLFDLSS